MLYSFQMSKRQRFTQSKSIQHLPLCRYTAAKAESRLPDWERLGHGMVIAVGRGDIRYASFVGMGRTKGWLDPVPVTNQIGRCTSRKSLDETF